MFVIPTNMHILLINKFWHSRDMCAVVASLSYVFIFRYVASYKQIMEFFKYYVDGQFQLNKPTVLPFWVHIAHARKEADVNIVIQRVLLAFYHRGNITDELFYKKNLFFI